MWPSCMRGLGAIPSLLGPQPHRASRVRRRAAAESTVAPDYGVQASDLALLSVPLPELMRRAEALRDQHHELITFSPKVFIPLTRLCRDSCGYCTFVLQPRPGRRAYMSEREVLAVAQLGAQQGCTEALFTLGDKPELRYPEAAEELRVMGYNSTLDYVFAAAEMVFRTTGLLPHINAGVMGEEEVGRLRGVSASQGLMLESVAPSLMQPGGAHYDCPDKDPALRLATIEAAGKAAVPFTSGVLIGIGETREEVIQSLAAIRQLHHRYGHIQEIIVQNFRSKQGTRMSGHAEPDLDYLLWACAVARIMFGPGMNIQAPPNLTPLEQEQGLDGNAGDSADRSRLQASWGALLRAGINDWGGISPITRDFVNPDKPWPHLAYLADATAAAGKLLVPRLPVYPEYARHGSSWLDGSGGAHSMVAAVRRQMDSSGLVRGSKWAPGQAETQTSSTGDSNTSNTSNSSNTGQGGHLAAQPLVQSSDDSVHAREHEEGRGNGTTRFPSIADGTSSGIGGTSSGIGGASSGIGGASSGIDGTSSGIGGTSSGIGGTSSGMGGTSSGNDGTSNGIEGRSSGTEVVSSSTERGTGSEGAGSSGRGSVASGEGHKKWWKVAMSPLGTIEGFATPSASPRLHALLQRVLQENHELTADNIAYLLRSRGADMRAVCDAADVLRRRVNGDVVTYVVNRNINYTNVCTFKCTFCAFSKGKAEEELRGSPYVVPLDEIARRAAEAWERGATEVCMQGGIHPAFTGRTYLDILEAVKGAVPGMHVHAFSPLEVHQGAATLGVPVKSFLRSLMAAGLGSLPGTAAEVLDDGVRAVLCPDKINTAQWLEVVRSAHEVGLRTTSTLMFGHMETDASRQWATHLVALRELQKQTGGITEFVPLPFVHMQAPLYLKGGSRRGPTLRECVLLHAVARLALNGWVRHIQASWVKMGPGRAAELLDAGCDDMGGSIMNESITKAAGAAHGQELVPERMEALIRAAGRFPQQRTTLYGTPPPQQVERSFGAALLRPVAANKGGRATGLVA